MKRKKMNRKQLGLALAFAVSANFMTACSERTVDYSMESGTADTESRDKRTGLKQFADVPTWKEEWTTVNSKGNTVKLQVDANVYLQCPDQMSVIEVKEPEFDAVFQKRIAGCLFDDENIFYHELQYLPKEELVEKRGELQELYDSYDPETSDPNEQSGMESILDEIQQYDRMIEQADESYLPIEDYDAHEYLGEREGNACILEFGDDKNDEGVSTWKEIRFYPKDLRQFCPEELKDVEKGEHVCCYPFTGLEIDNQCKLAMEDAKKLADELVEKLDLGYTKYRDVDPMGWEVLNVKDTAISEELYDGYVFYYDAGIEDISFLEEGTRSDYQSYYDAENFEKKEAAGADWYGMEAQLRVYVNEKGIVEVWADYPIEITGVSENVELLSLHDIQDIMRVSVVHDFENFWFEYTSEDYLVTFNEMALIYFRIRDRENRGHYSYVPVWRLADVMRYEDGELIIRNPVLINAIDGSVINIYDEI